MKNLRLGLYVVVLVSLIYVFTPCNVLAQDDGDIPIDWNVPSRAAQFTDSGIQSWAASVGIAPQKFDLIQSPLMGSLAGAHDRAYNSIFVPTITKVDLPANKKSWISIAL